MLTLLDEARTEFFGDYLTIDKPDAYVIVRIEIDYFAETHRQASPVSVEFHTARVGNSSLTTSETVRLPDGTVAARALVTSVLWNSEAGKPRPISDAERAAAAEYATSPHTGDDSPSVAGVVR